MISTAYPLMRMGVDDCLTIYDQILLSTKNNRHNELCLHIRHTYFISLLLHPGPSWMRYSRYHTYVTGHLAVMYLDRLLTKTTTFTSPPTFTKYDFHAFYDLFAITGSCISFPSHFLSTKRRLPLFHPTSFDGKEFIF